MAMKMKDSGIEWIGEIPESWEIRKLKYACKHVIDKITTSDEESQKPIIYVGLEHVEQQTGSLENSYEPIFDFTGDTIRFDINDVLFGKLRPYLAKCLLAEFGGKCSSEFFVFRSNSDIWPKYLRSILISKGFIDYVDSSTFGVKMPRADWGFVGNVFIPTPLLASQQRIADYIDQKCSEINKVIFAKQKQNELLKDQRQSIINEAVTKGLDRNVKYKESEIEWIGEIPEDWKLSRLKYHASVNGRIGFRGYTIDDIVVESQNGVLVLGGTNINKDGKLDLTEKTFISEFKYEESPEIKLLGGEILMTKVGAGLGQTTIVEKGLGKMTINPNVMIIKKFISINNKYLHYYLQNNSVQKIILLEGTKSGAQPAINQNFIRNLPIIVPQLIEQLQIADYLDRKCSEIDRIINSNNEIIEKLKEYRQSIIYEAVTGKTEVC